MNAANVSNLESNDYGPWAKVIQEATSHGFHHDKNQSSLSSEEGIQRVDRSLIFLEEIQQLLEQQEQKECPPMKPSNPPAFCDDNRRGESFSGSQQRNNPLSRTIACSRSKTTDKKQQTTTSRRTIQRSASKNQYSAIADESDDSSDDDSGIEGTNRDSKVRNGTNIDKSLSAEAIPYIPSLSPRNDRNRGNQEEGSSDTHHIDTMRLLIRLHASQSDLHAKKARLLAEQRKWLLGAGSLQSSIVALRKGLELADTAISAMDFASESTNSAGWANFSSPQEIIATYSIPTTGDAIPSTADIAAFADHRRAQLEMDAEITSISVHYLLTEKTRYIRSANAQVAKLQKILQRMWKGREKAMKRIGNGKWKSNSNTSNFTKEPSNFTKERQRYEQELWAIEEALRQLECSQMTTSDLVEEADQLREKLKQLRFAKNRYNGRRPRSPKNVMEPTSFLEEIAKEFGWGFTGSIDGVDCVQFFEKWVDVFDDATPQVPPSIPESIIVPNLNVESDDATNLYNDNLNGVDDDAAKSFVLVKLDYYFLTGAIQTVVEYPATFNDAGVLLQNAWSSTLAFNIDKEDFNSDAVYRQILANPLFTHRLYGGTNAVIV